MRITTIGMLLLVATTSKAQKVWTLDDCIDYALQHSAAVQKSRVAADNARQDRGAAAGGFIPTISASVSGQFSWGRNVDPETNTYNTITTFYNGYSVSSSLTLFDGLRTWNEFRKARLAVRQSDNALAQSLDEKAIEVMERYVDAVYNEAATALAQQKLDDSRYLLEKTRRMEELGEKSYPDVAQLEAQVATDEYSLEHQRTATEKAMVELQRVMGAPPAPQWRVKLCSDLGAAYTPHRGAGGPSFHHEAHGLGSLAAERLLSAENNLAAARLDYKIAWGQLLPTLTVGGGVSTSYFRNLTAGAIGTSFSSQMKDNLGEYIYATLSIPLFNFSTYRKIKKARNNIVLAEIERRETQLNVSSDYQQAVLDRDGYIKEVALLERKVASDSIAHHLNTRKYEEGMLSTFDLHTSAQTLHDSRVRLLQTRLMAEIKKRLVKSLTPKPSPRERGGNYP